MQIFAKAAVFDFDGTLVDSMPTWSEKMLRLLKLQGIEPPKGIVTKIATLGDEGTLDYFEKSFPLVWTREKMKKEMDEYALPRYANEIPLKDGAKEYLQELKKAGVGVYLLTASPHKMFEPALKRVGVFSLFDKAWSSDDFALPKSNPQIYLNLAKTIGVLPSEIAFFDDNIGAIESAKKAGLKTVAVYDKTGEEHIKRMKETADFYAYSLKDLL